MLRFVVISSENNSIKYKNLISKSMFNDDIHYETTCFFSIDKKFDEFCEKDYGGLVFIIDNSDVDSINIINIIRNKFNLHSAFIVVINDNSNIELENNMFLLKFINQDNLIENFQNSIKDIARIICNKKLSLTFLYNKILYKIPFNDILYFEKELNSKRCKIVCKKQIYYIYKSITEIQKMVDDRFVKTHQSTLVNKDNVKQVEFDTGVITFDSNASCNLISRNYKKNLKQMVPDKN